MAGTHPTPDGTEVRTEPADRASSNATHAPPLNGFHPVVPLASTVPARPIAADDGGQTEPPLLEAIGATSKLMADAKAAAASLDHLKRMLEQQVAIPGPEPMPQPLPEIAPQLTAEITEAPPPPPERTVLPPEPLPPPPASERAGFDLRGFAAGFALSCAVGALLYLFMRMG